MNTECQSSGNGSTNRRVSKGGAFGARAPPLSLMPNEKIYGD